MKILKKIIARLSSPLPLRERQRVGEQSSGMGLGVGLLLFGLLAMTSCTNDDNETVNPMDKKIVGIWLAEYEVEGTLTLSGEGRAYSRVLDVYKFMEERNISTWNRLFFSGDSPDPFADLGGGSGALGAFDFTTTADGNVSITLTGTYLIEPSDLPNYAPLARTLHYTDDTITATGIDGRTITLLRADEEDMQLLDEWHVRLNGGYGDNGYNVVSDVTDDDATEPMRARRR